MPKPNKPKGKKKTAKRQVGDAARAKAVLPTEEILKRALHAAPTVTTQHVVLPDVAAPSLSGLLVTLPPARDITPEDLVARFNQALRAQAVITARNVGEPVHMGDEVLVNMMGYRAGKLLPLSVRQQEWYSLVPNDPLLPGFGQALAGTPVGQAKAFTITLPPDYPAVAHRGMQVTFAVTIFEGQTVTLPSQTTGEVLKRLNKGKTLEDIFDTLGKEAAEQRELARTLQARDLVLDALAARAPLEIPKEWVDEEIRRRWVDAEGNHLAKLAIPMEDQQRALKGWQLDATLQASARRRIHISLVLRAVAAKSGIVMHPKQMDLALREFCQALDLPVAQVKSAMAEDPSLTAAVSHNFVQILAANHVMAHAKVTEAG